MNAIHRTSGAILAALLRFRNFRIHAKRDGISRPSRSKLKQALPGAECRESGTLRSEWEVGKAIFPSTPNVRFVHAESGGRNPERARGNCFGGQIVLKGVCPSRSHETL